MTAKETKETREALEQDTCHPILPPLRNGGYPYSQFHISLLIPKFLAPTYPVFEEQMVNNYY